MKSTAVLASLFFAVSAWAAPSPETLKSVLEQQPSCQNFVRHDDSYLYLGFGPYVNGVFEMPRAPIPGTVRVAPLDGRRGFELATKDSAIDAVSADGHTYILTYSSLEEWDLSQGRRLAEYPTYDHPGALDYKEHAQAMARYKDTLIIAHGRLGVSFFDLKAKKLTRQFRLIPSQAPMESMATAVAIQGNVAYVVMDDYTLVNPGQKPAFMGIVTINMDTQSVIAEIGGENSGTDAAISSADSLIVSFWGQPLLKYALGSLSGTTLPNPLYVANFPVAGHPIGKPEMDDTHYYTCFSVEPANHVGFYHRVPMALSLRDLHWTNGQ